MRLADALSWRAARALGPLGEIATLESRGAEVEQGGRCGSWQHCSVRASACVGGQGARMEVRSRRQFGVRHAAVEALPRSVQRSLCCPQQRAHRARGWSSASSRAPARRASRGRRPSACARAWTIGRALRRPAVDVQLDCPGGRASGVQVQKYPFISRIHARIHANCTLECVGLNPCSVSWQLDLRATERSLVEAGCRVIFGYKANTTDFVYDCKGGLPGALQLHLAPESQPPRANRPSIIELHDGVTVGRDTSCARRGSASRRMRVRRPASCRSRLHARVHVGAGSVVQIENVGGNGTRVSGEHTVAKNECRQLRKGQTVVFGRPGHPTEFAYTVHRAAAAPAAIELRLRGDVPTAPRRIELHDGLSIGRDESCDVVINDATVSRQHKQVERGEAQEQPVHDVQEQPQRSTALQRRRHRPARAPSASSTEGASPVPFASIGLRPLAERLRCRRARGARPTPRRRSASIFFRPSTQGVVLLGVEKKAGVGADGGGGRGGGGGGGGGGGRGRSVTTTNGRGRRAAAWRAARAGAAGRRVVRVAGRRNVQRLGAHGRRARGVRLHGLGEEMREAEEAANAAARGSREGGGLGVEEGRIEPRRADDAAERWRRRRRRPKRRRPSEAADDGARGATRRGRRS